MNLTHKSLVSVATASALFVVSSMAHADGPTTPAPAPAPAEPVAAPAKRSPLPIVTMAVGGTTALVGLCFYSLASTNKTQANFAQDFNQSYGSYGTTLETKELREKSESETRTGTVLLAGGAVVAIGGLVWFFFDGQRVRSANADAKGKATAATTLRLTPAVGPGSTGAYLQGTF